MIMVDVLSPAPSLYQYILYWRKSQYGASDAELRHIFDRVKTIICRLLASQGIKQIPLRPAIMEPIPGKKMLMMSRSRPHDFVSTFGTSCFLHAQNTSTSKTTLCTSSVKVFSSMCAGRKTEQTFTRFTGLSLVVLFANKTALTRSRPKLLGKDSTFWAFYFHLVLLCLLFSSSF